MRICISTNCQGAGIATFLRLAPNAAKYRISEIPHLVQFYQGIDPKAHPELPVAEQERMMREADVILYHAKGGSEPDLLHLNDTAIKIPLSVVYNSAYFMMCYEEPEQWRDIIRVAKENTLPDQDFVEWGVQHAVKHYDFNYRLRWASDLTKMIKKECMENVPQATVMSQFFAENHAERQPLLTKNHPTSYIFAEWTARLLRYLGEPVPAYQNISHLLSNPNMAGLPCEFSAGSGARRLLGLNWGARPEDDSSCADIARERITKLLSQ